MASEIVWRFLVVDDKKADEVEEFIFGNKVFEAPESIVVEKCENFTEALDRLDALRIDLVILDLKDDSIVIEDENTLFAGEKVFEQIRQRRFVPIVFHTAYPYKVENSENPFVRVVSRDDPKQLRQVIREVFQTGLPLLLRHLESEQRNYMWDHIQVHWQNFESSYDKADLTYLLGRRLANTLQGNSIRRFLAEQETGGLSIDDNTIHAVEMYIYPSTHPGYLAGDIFKSDLHGRDGYWIILTPSCDLEQDKVTHVILAACFLLLDQPEFKRIQESILKGQNPSNNAKKDLESLLGDNRNASHEGRRFQSERYSFLPGTFFLPDLVIDFQALIQVPLEKIRDENRIASLDSPFAEACLARFIRYYGRLGTPDINKDLVYSRILELIKKEM